MAVVPVLPLTDDVAIQRPGWRVPLIASLVCLSAIVVAQVAPEDNVDVLFQFQFAAQSSIAEAGTLLSSEDGTIYGTTSGGGDFGSGTIFRIDLHGRFEVLYSFPVGATPIGALTESESGTFYGLMRVEDGAGSPTSVFAFDGERALRRFYAFNNYPAGGSPVAGLTSGSDGFLYGTTIGAGTTGSIFRFDKHGAITVLHSLRMDGTEGAQPVGRLVESADGNFYGVTLGGGTHFAGAIFRVAPEGEFKVIHSFDPLKNGSHPAGGLTEAGGQFYGSLCASSKSHNNGLVFRLELDGKVSTVHAFSGAEGGCPVGELTSVAEGNSGYFSLLGVTRMGGPNGAGTLFRVSTRTGSLITVAGSARTGKSWSGSIAQGADGALYATTSTLEGRSGAVVRIRSRTSDRGLCDENITRTLHGPDTSLTEPN